MLVVVVDVVSWDDGGSNWTYEGLATYVEFLWAESLNDDIPLDHTTRILHTGVPDETRPLDRVDSIHNLLDGTTYKRAAFFYHALRIEIGEEAFFETLREFIQRTE